MPSRRMPQGCRHVAPVSSSRQEPRPILVALPSREALLTILGTERQHRQRWLGIRRVYPVDRDSFRNRVLTAYDDPLARIQRALTVRTMGSNLQRMINGFGPCPALPAEDAKINGVECRRADRYGVRLPLIRAHAPAHTISGPKSCRHQRPLCLTGAGTGGRKSCRDRGQPRRYRRAPRA
jgi:hypothetical protein